MRKIFYIRPKLKTFEFSWGLEYDIYGNPQPGGFEVIASCSEKEAVDLFFGIYGYILETWEVDCREIL